MTSIQSLYRLPMAALLIAACGSAEAPSEPAATVSVASVTLTPGSATLVVGDTLRFAATVRGANGSTLTGQAITWTSTNQSVATTSASGLVTALAAGTTTIRATVDEHVGEASLQVNAPAAPTTVQWDVAADTLAVHPNIILAFNSTAVGFRDDQNTLHAVWTNGSEVRHARRAAGASTWTSQPLPVSGAAQLRKPTLGYLGGAELVAAWMEVSGGVTVMRASRSRDRGVTWDPAISVAQGDYEGVVSLYAFRRPNGSPGAVLAWYDESLGRAMVSAWKGTAWSAADWTTPQEIASGTGVSHDVAVGGRGATVFAAWEDNRSGTMNQIYLAKSTDGGLTWSTDYLLPVAGAATLRSGDPAISIAGDGTVVLVLQSLNRVFVTTSTDGGATFGPIQELGPGLFAHIAVNDAGAVAVSWEHFTGSQLDDSQKRIGLAVRLPSAATYDAPHAMPGTASHTGDVQASTSLSQQWIDIFWIDTAGGTRTLLHRAGRLP